MTLVAPAGTSVERDSRVETIDGRELWAEDTDRADTGPRPAGEHRTPVATIEKDTPVRQLGMYAHMKGDYDEQL